MGKRSIMDLHTLLRARKKSRLSMVNWDPYVILDGTGWVIFLKIGQAKERTLG